MADTTQATMNVVEFVIDTISHIRKLEEPEVRATLTEMGFNEEMQAGPITRLSGGWKMKLALVRGMLCKTVRLHALIGCYGRHAGQGHALRGCYGRHRKPV